MDPITFGLAVVPASIAVGALLLAFLFWRGRPFTKEARVFRASRLTGGNHLFPTQVAIFPGRVVRWTPRWLGHSEQTISVAQVASVRIEAGTFFADVLIETTGGSQPIVCHGHWRKDGDAIRDAIQGASGAVRQGG